jgi:cytochrome P450
MTGPATNANDKPAHVPPELVWNRSFDAFTAEGGDPFRAVARLHEGPGIVWSPDASYGRPGWIVTRYDLVSEVFLDHERFSGERKGMVADLVGENVRLNPIEIDPPAHHGYRRNLNPQFTPRAVNGLEAAVRDTCARLIAAFREPDGCEFISEFAVPFPTYVFLDLMAMPRERAGDFLAWEDALMRAADPTDRVRAAQAIYEYLKGHKSRQQAAPANDLNRAIVTGEFEGRPLNHLEMMGMYYVLWVGGLDTVYSTLGWIMRHLATHLDLQQRLRENPADIPAAIEEFARAFAVVVTHREVAKDCEFRGVQMRKGEEVNLPLALANRDPAVFDDPHVVDIDRKPRHLTFGFGAHACLGIHLAKRELRVVVEECLMRFRNIRMREGEEYRYHTGRTFGVEYLPLVWERA